MPERLSKWNKAVGMAICSPSQQIKSVWIGEKKQKVWFHAQQILIGGTKKKGEESRVQKFDWVSAILKSL